MVVVGGFALAGGASAETIKAKMDGDRTKDTVVAGRGDANSTRVAAVLSAHNNKLSYVDLPGAGNSEPYIKAKGNVNKGRGAELFVQSGRNAVVDTISVLTVARGNLVMAGNFYVNGALGDGLAFGIRCASVKGEPGIRAYVFKLGNRGRWNRYVTPFGWRKGSLVRRGKKTKSKVALPSPAETGLGCPKPAPPPEPPPVLGSAGSRYFLGLGTVTPKSFRARQGTGRYFSLKWTGWGGARATARGYFNTGAPGAGKKRLNLTAFDLGRCAGREGYRKLTLKQKGSRGITLGVC